MMNSTKVEIVVEEDFVSGYKLAKYVEMFSNRTKVNPQQVYNYMKNNLIPTTLHEGRLMVSKVDAETWLKKYCSKH